MSEEKFSLEDLYDGHADPLFYWLESFSKGIGVDIRGNQEEVIRFLVALTEKKTNFPAKGGFEAASAFKKAAAIYVLLHQYDPFKDVNLDLTINGIDLNKFDQSAASIIGLALVRECLHEAVILKGEKAVIIEQPIDYSDHFLVDLVEASRGITMNQHFRTYSLLFESLVYQTNSSIPCNYSGS